MIHLIPFAAPCDHFEVPHSKKEVKLLIVHFFFCTVRILTFDKYIDFNALVLETWLKMI